MVNAMSTTLTPYVQATSSSDLSRGRKSVQIGKFTVVTSSRTEMRQALDDCSEQPTVHDLVAACIRDQSLRRVTWNGRLGPEQYAALRDTAPADPAEAAIRAAILDTEVPHVDIR